MPGPPGSKHIDENWAESLQAGARRSEILKTQDAISHQLPDSMKQAFVIQDDADCANFLEQIQESGIASRCLFAHDVPDASRIALLVEDESNVAHGDADRQATNAECVLQELPWDMRAAFLYNDNNAPPPTWIQVIEKPPAAPQGDACKRRVPAKKLVSMMRLLGQVWLETIRRRHARQPC